MSSENKIISKISHRGGLTNTNNLRSPQDLLIAFIRGARNGMYYGGQVRFTHALVIAILFRPGTLSTKIKWIAQATWEHAWNLGRFVFVYKVVFTLLVRLFGHGYGVSSFIGGAVAARFSDGVNPTSVN